MTRIRRCWAMLACSALLAASCGGATPLPSAVPPDNTPTVDIQGNPTNANLEALLIRLAQERAPLVNNSQLLPQRPVVTVAGLPASLPFALPLPEHTVIVGSVQRPDLLRGEGLILLAVPQPAAQINAFFQAALAQQGFSPWQPGGPQSFQPARSQLLFCQREQVISA